MRKTWNDLISEFEQWVRAHGRLPRSTVDDIVEKRLAYWRLKQRKLYKKGKLKAETIAMLRQVQALESLQDGKWHEMFNEVQQFFTRYGRMPTHHTNADEDEKRIARWRYNTIHDLEEGFLHPDRAELFTKAGFDRKRNRAGALIGAAPEIGPDEDRKSVV
jgi:hypothetical protein